MRRTSPQGGRWPVHRLGEVLIRHNEVVHPGERTGEATFVGLEHVEPNSGRRIGLSTLDLGSLTGRKPTFRRGQIVYGYLRPYLNKVWVAEFDGYSSVDQFAYDVQPELADTAFIAAFMRSEAFLRLASVVTTTGQLPRIGTEQIAAVQIELPPVETQRRIAAVIDEQERSINRAKHASCQRMSAVNSLHSALLRSAFEGPPAASWKPVRLGSVAQVTGGLQKTPDRQPISHHCPYLTVRNVQRGVLDLTHVERFEVTPGELDRLRLVKGDILIVEGNGSPDQIGRNAIFDLAGSDWIHQNHVIRVRVEGGVSSDYVSLFLNSPQGRQQMLERARSTSGLFTLSVGKIESLEVPLPPIGQQISIVDGLKSRIDAADRLREVCRQDALTVEALPSALLRFAFPIPV